MQFANPVVVAKIAASDVVVYGMMTQMGETQVVWTLSACDQPPDSQSRHAPLVPMANFHSPNAVFICLVDMGAMARNRLASLVPHLISGTTNQQVFPKTMLELVCRSVDYIQGVPSEIVAEFHGLTSLGKHYFSSHPEYAPPFFVCGPPGKMAAALVANKLVGQTPDRKFFKLDVQFFSGVVEHLKAPFDPKRVRAGPGGRGGRGGRGRGRSARALFAYFQVALAKCAS
jgi:hypothetical protein